MEGTESTLSVLVSSPYRTADILGVRFAALDKEQLLCLLESRLRQRQKTLVLSGNVHAMNLAYEQSWLHDFFNSADLIRIDGVGLRLGARLLGYWLPPRMTWADFIWDLAAFAEARGFSLFFLGGHPGIAEAAANCVRERHPDIRIFDTHHGYFDKMPGHSENEAVLAAVRSTRPDILIVGFGSPIQERWLRQNWSCIEATVTLTGGAVFDYTSGHLTRAPDWLTRYGLEWLGRLLIEPGRLWRRYLIGNPLFLLRILGQRLGLSPWSSA